MLRGLCVVAMVVDHIAGESPLDALTGGNRFYTSAAEAFIFISGFTMGLVYRPLITWDGLAQGLLRVARRGVTLYLVTVTLTFLIIPVSETLQLPWNQGIDLTDRWALMVSILTLHRTYYLVDIPLLYTIALFVSPLVLVLLSQGYTGVVVGASLALWAAYQLFPEYAGTPWDITGNYLFHFSAWQIFFVIGMVLGWHREAFAERLARVPRRLGLATSAVGFAALIVLYRLTDVTQLVPTDSEQAQDLKLFLLQAVFSKADVRPGRIV
ncbi:MAG TPA: OpgC domain-containing protein, partial [Chloroflexota bacterium]